MRIERLFKREEGFLDQLVEGKVMKEFESRVNN